MAKEYDGPAKDYWSAEAYKNAASFVPKLTNTVLKYLDPQPTDRILDIGCGDGILTAQIAAELKQGGSITGLDASSSFITSAKSTNQPKNCSYELQDCSKLEHSPLIDGTWDKVFSNAALHWILRRESSRQGVFNNVYKALKPGGSFVFEMGGHGNVAEFVAALLSALVATGVTIQEARERSPWYFPSTDWCRAALETAGFTVEICELEYRPTLATQGGGGTGIDGWLRLMAAQFVEGMDESAKDKVFKHVRDLLETVITKEDGTQWIGNVRLRAVARKPQ